MRKMAQFSSLARRFGLEFIQPSPADVRVLLRVAAFLVIWKLLSSDYSALWLLARGTPLYAIPEPFTGIVPLLQWFFVKQPAAALAQWCAIIGLALFMVKLQRRFLLIGVAAGIALEMCACLYRFNLYQLEFPLALLLWVAVYPTAVSRLCRLERWQDSPSGRSLRFLGQLLVLYIACAYFTTGVSKLYFDIHWTRIIGLEYLYPFAQLCHLGHPLAPIRTVGTAIHDILAAQPSLGELLGMVTLVAELGWILVPFVRRLRFFIPFLMLSIHVGVFFSGGPIFVTMALLQTCVAVNWARVRGFFQPATAPATSDLPVARAGRGRLWLQGVGVCLVLLAILYPILVGTLIPFGNFPNFGWSYKTGVMGHGKHVYALGCHDALTNRVTPAAVNNGGFMDFRLASIASVHAKIYFTSADPSCRAAALSTVQRLARAIRPYGSNEALLGPLSFPADMPYVTATRPLPGSRSYLLRGTLECQEGQLVVSWDRVIPLDRANPQLPVTEQSESGVATLPFVLEDTRLTRQIVTELRAR